MDSFYFVPFGEAEKITSDEIFKLAEQINVDAVLNWAFTQRKPQILRYAAEVAAIERDASLVREERASALSSALLNLAEAATLDEDAVDNDLADSGGNPNHSWVVVELHALLAQKFIEEQLTSALGAVPFPRSQFITEPALWVYELGNRTFLFFTDYGTFEITATNLEAAFGDLQAKVDAAVAEGTSPGYISIVTADGVRESVQYALENPEG